MVVTGKNMSSLKENNKNSITLYIHKYGPSSRKTIADVIGITQAAVGKICKELIDEKLLYEIGSKDSSHAGRREVLLDLNYKNFYCIGINLFRENIVAIVTYIDGEEVLKIEEIYDTNIGLSEQILKILKNLINNTSIDTNNIKGIGVSSRGKTDYQNGKIMLTSGEVVYIKEEIEKEFGIKTYVNNNVRNLMIQEISLSNLTRDTIFIKWGPGLGSSIYIDQNIVYGSNLKAGEIGKIIVNNDNGKISTLEGIFSEGQIVNDVMSNFNKSTMPVLSKIVEKKEDINIDSIINVLNSSEDDYVKRIVIDKVDILLEKLNTIDSILDVNNIILYGKIFEQDKFFYSIENIVNRKFKNLGGKIKKSKLKQENECYAAIYLVISNIFS
jgi:predicted NBD/HSP70 family sugar kinase